MRRRHFVEAVASAAVAQAFVADRANAQDATDWRNGTSLVMAGGGARGAYEAGVVEGLRRAYGLRDGDAFPFADVVCGTSIGALNGWFVSTGRYSALRDAWSTIASANIFRLKRRYAAVADDRSGVLSRAYGGLSLLAGIGKTDTSILDSAPVEAWIERYVDPAVPHVSILGFSATNLQRRAAEVFYRLPSASLLAKRASAERSVRSVLGDRTVVRSVDNDLLRDALRASAAIPVLLAPVSLPTIDGGLNQYVDGGVADNTPIDLARSVSRTVHAILVDPTTDRETNYGNASAIGVGSFEVAQQRILDGALRDAALEAQGKRLFGMHAASPEQRAYMDRIFAAEFKVIRPAGPLPVDTVGFTNQAAIDETYAMGVADGKAGWQPYISA